MASSPPPSSSSATPPVKKLKMSSPSASDEEGEAGHQNGGSAAAPGLPPSSPAIGDGGGARRRPKRRKVAIILGYCGAGYQGMQKNPGAKTIEGDLEEALFLSGGVPEADRGAPRRYDWARAARTDKGVSAAGQVVSGRFYVDPPGFVDRLNANLPPQIRIYGIKRVTSSFSAKKFCDRRRYIYFLPVFALDPNAHPDREAVTASLGSDNELTKCLECSERGRKVPGLMGRPWENGSDSQSRAAGAGELDGTSDAPDSVPKSPAAPAGEFDGSSDAPVSVPKSPAAAAGEFDGSSDAPLSDPQSPAAAAGKFDGSSDAPVSDPISGEGLTSEAPETAGSVIKAGEFRYGEEEKRRFNAILGRYVGTHNFHNFTTRTKAEDPSARRYIVSFGAGEVVSMSGIDFIRCEVVGQSFMLHQIRKMIGLAVAVMRNCASETIMEAALRKDVNINVPTAPEVGLYLDECFFTSYNNKWKDSHEAVTMEGYAEAAEAFKAEFIFPHIANMEEKEGAVALWLHSLNRRNYPDFQSPAADGGGNIAVQSL